MTEPTTESGTDLIARFMRHGERHPVLRGLYGPADVVRIEREAADAALARVEAAVRDRKHTDRPTAAGLIYDAALDWALAAIHEERSHA
jgi:hypothetical protein